MNPGLFVHSPDPAQFGQSEAYSNESLQSVCWLRLGFDSKIRKKCDRQHFFQSISIWQ